MVSRISRLRREFVFFNSFGKSIYTPIPLENGDYFAGSNSNSRYFEGAGQIAEDELSVLSTKLAPPLAYSSSLVRKTQAETEKPSQDFFLEGCVAQIPNDLSPVDVNVSMSLCQSTPNKPDLEISFASPFFRETDAAEKADAPGRSFGYFDYFSIQHPTEVPDEVSASTTASNPPQSSRSKLPPSGKLYNCRYCGKAYQNLTSLKNHQQRHEAGDVVMKRHKCPFCAYSSQYHRNLLKHVAAAHGKHNYTSAAPTVSVMANKFENRQRKLPLGSVPVGSGSVDTPAGDISLLPSPLLTTESPSLQRKLSIAELLCSNSPGTQNFIDAHSFSPSDDFTSPSFHPFVGTSDSHHHTCESVQPLPFINDSFGRPGSTEAHQCVFRTNHIYDCHGKGRAIRCSAEDCHYICNRQVHMKRHMAEKHPRKKVANCAPSGQAQNFTNEVALDAQKSSEISETSKFLLPARTYFSSLPPLTVQVPYNSSVSTEIPKFEGSGYPTPSLVSPRDRPPQNAQFYHQSPHPLPALIPTPYAWPYPSFDSVEPPHLDSRGLPPMQTSTSYAPQAILDYKKEATTSFEQTPDGRCPQLIKIPHAHRPSYMRNDVDEFAPSVSPLKSRPEASEIDVTFIELNAVLSRDLDEIADGAKNCGESQFPFGQKCEIAPLVPEYLSRRSPSFYSSTDSGNGSMASARSLSGSTYGASTAEAGGRQECGSVLTGTPVSISCSPPASFCSLLSCYSSPDVGDKVSCLSSAGSALSAASGGHHQSSSHYRNVADNLGGYFQPEKRQRPTMQSSPHSRFSTPPEPVEFYHRAACREHALQGSCYANKELIPSQSDRPVRPPSASRDLRQHYPDFIEPSPSRYSKNPSPTYGCHSPTSNILSHITLEKHRFDRPSDYIAASQPPTANQQPDVGLKSNYRTQSPYYLAYQPRSAFGACEVGDDASYSPLLPPTPLNPPSGLYGQTDLNSLRSYPTDHPMPCVSLCTVCTRTTREEQFYTTTQHWFEPASGQLSEVYSDNFPPLRTYFSRTEPQHGFVQTHVCKRERPAHALQQTDATNFSDDKDALWPRTVAVQSSPQYVSSVVKPPGYTTSAAPCCEGSPYAPVNPSLSRPTVISNLTLSTFEMDSHSSRSLRNCPSPTVAVQTPMPCVGPMQISTAAGGVHPASLNSACDGGTKHPISTFPLHQGDVPFFLDCAPTLMNGEKGKSDSSARFECMSQSVHSIDNECYLNRVLPNFDALQFPPGGFGFRKVFREA
ncbi:hypothetical protein SprV_0200733100 [Sparganum proliferum]